MTLGEWNECFTVSKPLLPFVAEENGILTAWWLMEWFPSWESKWRSCGGEMKVALGNTHQLVYMWVLCSLKTPAAAAAPLKPMGLKDRSIRKAFRLSFQALLDLYLLESIEESDKHAIVSFLDLVITPSVCAHKCSYVCHLCGWQHFLVHDSNPVWMNMFRRELNPRQSIA